MFIVNKLFHFPTLERIRFLSPTHLPLFNILLMSRTTRYITNYEVLLATSWEKIIKIVKINENFNAVVKPIKLLDPAGLVGQFQA